jgi:hypothetical protein
MKIDHYTQKEYDSFHFINLVFSLNDDHTERCSRLIFNQHHGEFEKVRVMNSPEEFNAYYDGLELVYGDEVLSDGSRSVTILSNYEKEPVEMYKAVVNSLLNYIEKFDKYVYRGYIEKNPLTEGGIKMLEELIQTMKESYDQNLVAQYSSDLLRILSAIDFFWD